MATYIDGRLSVGQEINIHSLLRLIQMTYQRKLLKKDKKSDTELWYKAKSNTIIVVAEKRLMHWKLLHYSLIFFACFFSL